MSRDVSATLTAAGWLVDEIISSGDTLDANLKLKIRHGRVSLPPFPLRRRVMEVPPSMGSATTSAGAGFSTTPLRISSTQMNNGSIAFPTAGLTPGITSDYFSYSGGGDFRRSSAASPGYNFVGPLNVTTSGTSTYGSSGYGIHFQHTGSEFGLSFKGDSGKFTVRIDGEYVGITSACAAAIVAGGSGYAVSDTITLPYGGVVLTVATVSAGAILTVTVSTPGSLSGAKPPNPISQASTSGSGTGATFNVQWRADPQIFTLAGDGLDYFYRFGMGYRTQRRIDVRVWNCVFGGAIISGLDSIQPAPIRGPRVICMGDSFTDGTGASALTVNNWCANLADFLGWDDVWSSGVGGTGYIADSSGTKATFGQRVQHDVIQYDPDVVIVFGGFNDKASTATLVGAAADSLFAALRAGLPDAILIGSTNNNVGVNGLTPTYLGIIKRIQSAVERVGGFWGDLQEIPLTTDAVTTTLTASITAGLLGATGFSCAAPLARGSTVEINGTERVQISDCTGGPVGYTGIFRGTAQSSHANGSTVTQVGGSFWTGTGSIASPQSFGSCTEMVSNDTVHPSTLGHEGIGYAMGCTLMRVLAPN